MYCTYVVKYVELKPSGKYIYSFQIKITQNDM